MYYSLASGITSTLWSALLCTTAYLIFVRPRVIIFDEGIAIINPFNKVVVGWEEVVAIDVRYTMSIRVRSPFKALPWNRTASETIYAFAAPAPGRYHARTIHQSEIRGIGIDHSLALRPGDSPRTASGQVAALARIRLEEFEKRGGQGSIGARCEHNRSAMLALAIALLLITINGVL